MPVVSFFLFWRGIVTRNGLNSCEFCKISYKTFFTEYPRMTASKLIYSKFSTYFFDLPNFWVKFTNLFLTSQNKVEDFTFDDLTYFRTRDINWEMQNLTLWKGL